MKDLRKILSELYREKSFSEDRPRRDETIVLDGTEIKNSTTSDGSFADDPHDNAAHSTNYAPEDHDNTSHSENYATTTYVDDRVRQVAAIPTTTLADTEYITTRVHVPTDRSLNLWAVGVQNAANNAPAGLTADADDETNGTTLVSENAKRSTGAPLASVDGAVDVALRARNATGGEQDASAVFEYTIE